MSPPRTPTQQPGQDTTDEVARDRTERLRDDVADLRREIDEVDDRVASVLLELREHRTASQSQHAATQSAIADIAKRLDAQVAARAGGQDGPAAPPPASPPSGGLLASVPPAVWGGAGTAVGAALATVIAMLAAMSGVPAKPATPPPDPVVVPHREDGGGATPAP